MGPASIAERARLGRLMAVDAWHAFLRRLTYYSVSWDAFTLFDRGELTLAPQDIRTADPTIAEDIYSGRFAFAGEIMEEPTESPFLVIPPSVAWAHELHSFSWLRHLRASERAIAQANAQALVHDWIETTKLANPYAWSPDVVATRVLAWISQSPLILTGCDVAFYQKFARSLTRQVRFLRKSINNAPDGLPRLKATMALAAASIALSNQTRFRRPSLKRLDQELQRQILPDGGHFSRNPGPLIEILLDLLPLRQTILAAQMLPSQTLMNTVDRMIPMIRFFQMGDGAFARFNGIGGTSVDLVAAILAHDDARGTPPFNASHSGYQRIQAGDTVLIMDTGAPPPVSVSHEAHAGCLSFEMSAGNKPMIVNCGRPRNEYAALRRLARTTAAHSTLTIGTGSSCRFAPLTRFSVTHGVAVLSGPSAPDVTREDAGGTTFLSARHDGYHRATGLLHERALTIHTGGQLIEGIDSLIQTGQRPNHENHEFAIRFHLHPFVKPGPVEPGGTVRLSVRGGQIWRFAAPGNDIEIDESVYLSDIVGSLKTSQIVIHGKTPNRQSVTWRLERMQDMELLSDFEALDLEEPDFDAISPIVPDPASAPLEETAANPEAPESSTSERPATETGEPEPAKSTPPPLPSVAPVGSGFPELPPVVIPEIDSADRIDPNIGSAPVPAGDSDRIEPVIPDLDIDPAPPTGSKDETDPSTADSSDQDGSDPGLPAPTIEEPTGTGFPVLSPVATSEPSSSDVPEPQIDPEAGPVGDGEPLEPVIPEPRVEPEPAPGTETETGSPVADDTDPSGASPKLPTVDDSTSADFPVLSPVSGPEPTSSEAPEPQIDPEAGPVGDGEPLEPVIPEPRVEPEPAPGTETETGSPVADDIDPSGSSPKIPTVEDPTSADFPVLSPVTGPESTSAEAPVPQIEPEIGPVGDEDSLEPVIPETRVEPEPAAESETEPVTAETDDPDASEVGPQVPVSEETTIIGPPHPPHETATDAVTPEAPEAESNPDSDDSSQQETDESVEAEPENSSGTPVETETASNGDTEAEATSPSASSDEGEETRSDGPNGTRKD